MRRSGLFVLVLVAGTWPLVLAGCGGDDASSDAIAGGADASEAAATDAGRTTDATVADTGLQPDTGSRDGGAADAEVDTGTADADGGAGSRRVVAVAAGSFHTCAVHASGEVSCWGENLNGALGIGQINGPSRCANPSSPASTLPCATAPVTVTGVNDATGIVAGDSFSCALRAGGRVSCWGENRFGEVGVAAGTEQCRQGDAGPTTSCVTTPVAVNGLSGASALSAGYGHVCALLTTGEVRCWGGNMFGQLGNGTTTPSSAPVAVTGITNAVSIAVGDLHSCAQLADGTVKCWGYNNHGQLGNGSTTGPDTCGAEQCAKAPVAVTGLAGATAVALGQFGSCAVLGDAGVACWGDNSRGRFGNGTTDNSSTPASSATGATDIKSLAMASAHTCALSSTGTVTCWGDNEYGEVGAGLLAGPDDCSGSACATSPTAVVGLTNASSLAALSTSLHTCVVTSAGGVRCWGSNEYGQLGNGTSSGPETCTGFGTATPCATSSVSVSGL